VRLDAIAGLALSLLVATGLGCAASCRDGGDRAAGEPWTTVELPGLGVAVDAPADARRSILGGITAMGHTCAPSIHLVGPASPGPGSRVANVEKGHYGGFVRWLHRSLPAGATASRDGAFVLEYAGVDSWGYFSRRMVGARTIECDQVSASERGHRCVVRVCSSMRAL
jgi:hypothetical protein